MSHFILSGREFNAIVKVLKGSDFSGALCVHDHALYLYDPYFAMRVRFLDKNLENMVDFFESDASYTITKENSAGIKVSDEVVLEEDGSWFVRTGRVSEPVPSSTPMRNVEVLQNWFANAGQEVSQVKLTTATLKHIVETADAFKIAGAPELRFDDRMMYGRMEDADVKQSKTLVRPKVEIDFVSTVAR